MKLAKTLWSLGSLFVNIPIIIYVVLSTNAPKSIQERILYINENWDIYELHWKAEFLLMAMIAVGAVYFAIRLKKAGWAVIAVGQLILLSTYPIMLGGYRNTPVEIFEMANQMAITVFLFGNIVFLFGLLHLYLYDFILKKWLRLTAVSLAAISALVFSITYVGAISWKQAMIIGPLVNVLYLINAYYGLKINGQQRPRQDL